MRRNELNPVGRPQESNVALKPNTNIVSENLTTSKPAFPQLIVGPADLVRLARETGAINLLSDQQRETLNDHYPTDGTLVSLSQLAAKPGRITRGGLSRREVRAFRKLRKIFEVKPSVVKTHSMRMVEERFGMPVERVLQNMVDEGLTKKKIAAKLGSDRKTVGDWVGKLEIKAAIEIKKTEAMLDAEKKFKETVENILFRLHWEEKKSFRDVSLVLGIDLKTVWRWFNRFGIPRRDRAEAVRLAQSNPEKREKIYRKTKKTRRKLSKSAKEAWRRRKERKLVQATT